MLRFGGTDERLDAPHYTLRKNSVAGAQHLRVIGRQHILSAEEHLLVKLLARSHAREPDLDVGADSQARESDQVGGDVDYPDGLSHVEQEDLTAASERAGLQHQLD